ncbi:TPA: dUTP diphosphatase [Candidatus Uhrbacteria bacterium]|nr:dUTP diphosphatase [Candidatus Uhrbacteria bacterium]
MLISFKKTHPAALTPAFQTPGAAGFDLALVEDLTIPPRSFSKTSTGLIIQVPTGYFLLITSRSSNSLKKGIALANGVGIIDSDYCGPNDIIGLIIENITDLPVSLKAGDRVAQGLILPVPAITFTELTGDITTSDRGGFGSTG